MKEVVTGAAINYSAYLMQIQENQESLFLIEACICFFLAFLTGILFAKIVWRKF